MNTSILQWNIQGLSGKKDELLDLINTCNASIIALQETKLSNDYLTKISKYSVISKEGHYNQGYHGGVALYIHPDVIHSKIDLNTPCQAVAAVVALSFRFTICNIYSPPSLPLNKQLLSDIFQQLPSPCLIVGDFNANSLLWGSANTNTRGRSIEAFLAENNLNILNDGSPTRIAISSETAIDLSFCSPSIFFRFDWSVYGSPLVSDHCPVIIETDDITPEPSPPS